MKPFEIKLCGFDLWVLWAFSQNGLCLMEFGLENPPPSLFISLEEREEKHPTSWDREMTSWVKNYEKGKFANFSLPLDLSDQSSFQSQVLKTLTERVGAGQTVSYQELAALSGRPLAHRAVGSTMATNPLAFAVPCHRVLHAGNQQTSYGKGVFYKWLLLRHEMGEDTVVESMKSKYRNTFPVKVEE